jgi:hypothetical protein
LLVTLVVLIIGGALLVPHAFAGSYPPFDSPPSAIQPNVSDTGAVNITFSSAKPGQTFYVYIDIVNVTNLLGYQVGFTFNQTFLQVTNVTDGGFLTSAGGTILTSLGYGDHGLASVDNSTGSVTAVTEELSAGPFSNGTGHLVQVGFEINPALSYAGGPVSMMQFNLVSGDTHELILYSSDGTDITPPQSQVHNGYITVSTVVPEFSPVFFATLLITATFGTALLSKAEWSRKRKD